MCPMLARLMDHNDILRELGRRAGDPQLASDSGKQWGQVGAPPLDLALLERAEILLGRRLPQLLRETYLTVGNGGFGPGYGLLPLIDSQFEHVEPVVELYAALSTPSEDDPVAWPADLVPFCEWGCAIRTCVDCANGHVVTFDPNPREDGESMSVALAETHASLAEWFSDWLDGVKLWDLMYEADTTRSYQMVNFKTMEPFTVEGTKLRRRSEAG